MIPTISDVRAARERLAGGPHRTPLLRSRLLGEHAGGAAFLKPENLQRAGAFKFRGALHAIRTLADDERRRGVVTYSSGNHGQALALAAREEGVRAVVFMPEDAPAAKVAAARSYGADVRFAGTTSPERKAAAEALVDREGVVVVPPFDDPRIVAGQGTVGLELVEDLPDVDVVLVPVGGGGLAAGVTLALKASRPDVEIVAVEPTTADGLGRALAAGAPVEIPAPTTIADGLKPLQVGEIPFAILSEHRARAVTVTDEEILDAMRFLALRARLVVEPSGAAGVAALRAGKVPLEGRTAAVVLSGGNVDPALLARALGSEGFDG